MQKHIYLISLVMLMLGSCSGLKFVPENELLYTGAKVKVADGAKSKEQSYAVSEAKDIIRPQPNKTFLGMRPGLWWWYHTQTTKETGFKKWLNKKLGQAPVYYSQVDPDLVSRAIDARLYNQGFFDSYSSYEMIQKEHSKTVSIVYTLTLKDPYYVAEVIFPKGTDTLNKTVAATKEDCLVEPGDRYNLDELMDERVRIDALMKEQGFYYFAPDYLVFKVDTALGARKLKLSVEVKPDVPDQSKKVYVIEEVNLFPDYKMGKENRKQNLRVIDSVNYYSENDYIRPTPVLRSVFLRNDKIYNRTDHNLTLNRLMGLGVFKFVNVRITRKDSTSNGLKANVLLSPLPKKSLSLEVQGASKSNNFLGPGIAVGFRNRNALRGAELLIVNVRGSFETQLNGPYKGQFTYELNPKVELYVPRFITPFNIKTSSMFVPKTKFALDYSYMSRVNYFDLNSFKFSFGYRWKESATKDHDLSLVSVNYFNIYNQSQSFLDLINTNILLKRRYEEQLIAGFAYSFFYNQQVDETKKHPFYFNVNAELSGSPISAYYRLTGMKPDPEKPLQLLGVKYSEFGRLDVDIRQYFKLGRDGKRSVALRFIAGWGKPFGNSSNMPYIKQFFSGGAYSVRGFAAYSVGPGTYLPPDSLRNLFFLQQGGEIRLEGNAEYRFTLTGFLKGALFIDAGNTWLNSSNPSVPGGAFNASSFYNELAVGSGFGLRIDVQFFVLRLDLGIPLRKPWMPDGERWVIDQFDFGSAKWRRENLVLNIAFGYPF